MRAATRRHVELIDQAASRHAGVRAVEQGAGDSTVVAFDRVSDAFGAAVDVQLAFAAEQWPTAEPLRVRIALHVGEVHVGADSSYAGPTMSRCGRLLAAAQPGQVVELESDLFEGAGGRADLGDDVFAFAAVIEHAFYAGELAADGVEAPADVFDDAFGDLHDARIIPWWVCDIRPRILGRSSLSVREHAAVERNQNAESLMKLAFEKYFL